MEKAIELKSDENLEEKSKLGILTEKEVYEIPSVLQSVLDQKDFIRDVAKKLTEQKIHHLFLIGAGS